MLDSEVNPVESTHFHVTVNPVESTHCHVTVNPVESAHCHVTVRRYVVVVRRPAEWTLLEQKSGRCHFSSQ